MLSMHDNYSMHFVVVYYLRVIKSQSFLFVLNICLFFQ